ncbi:MAG: hypothetical protein KGL51_15800 [Betaproteobacteria bacterium]|nr:hypothetical protein [Betaproteobacteria bacterium]MDE2124314.1 hypothetical protein [Betaproteobacteria bacterium]MDE2186219.1 hypothetical protein [Betaproteobacteria bacterium]MDE2326103.1 hypothetical protein [Betaproteobacteria bacterium]
MRKMKSPILDAVHETAKGLHKAVQKREIGQKQKRPTGTALKLLHLVVQTRGLEVVA